MAPSLKPRLRGLFACAALLLLAAALYRDAVRAAGVLTLRAADRVAHWARYEQAYATSGSGAEVLPESITAAVTILNATPEKTFRLSEAMAGDEFFKQRIAEHAWPAVFDAASPLLVRRRDEISACTRLSEAAEVAIDRCH